jgi:hypothetical protein
VRGSGRRPGSYTVAKPERRANPPAKPACSLRLRQGGDATRNPPA